MFEEGRALIEAGKPEEACLKFEQSIAKDPRQVGVLMNLGLCNERSGKIATALRMYQEAFDRAVDANLAATKDRAADEINKLAPKVPRIVFKRAGPALPDEKLVVDDVVVPARKELPLDPGRHTIVFTAPGRLAFETRVDLELLDRKQVVLPVLEVPRTKVVTRQTPTRLITGRIATFAGLGILLAGSGLVIYAKHDYDQLFDGGAPHCGVYTSLDGDPICDAYGQSRAERDRNIVIAGTVVSAVGLAAATTGLVLWLTSPTETTKTTLQPIGTTTSVGVVLRGRF